jgi:hypothetical protein
VLNYLYGTLAKPPLGILATTGRFNLRSGEQRSKMLVEGIFPFSSITKLGCKERALPAYRVSNIPADSSFKLFFGEGGLSCETTGASISRSVEKKPLEEEPGSEEDGFTESKTDSSLTLEDGEFPFEWVFE